MRYFQKDEYKKKFIYTSTHYLHLLQFLHHCDFPTLFNAHLHQLIIHEILNEDDIILLLQSPFVDIHYIYQHKKYEDEISKHIQDFIYQDNIRIENVRKNISDSKYKFQQMNRKCSSSSTLSSISSVSSSSTSFSPDKEEKQEEKQEEEKEKKRKEEKEKKQEEEKEKKKEEEKSYQESLHSANPEKQKEYLFEYFASSKSIDYSIYEGSNLLILASIKEYDKLVCHILNQYPDQNVNCTNQKKESPLFLCCQNSLSQSSKYLLSHPNIDINLFNENNEHLLIICCKNKLNNQALQILSHQTCKDFLQKNHFDYNGKNYDDPTLYVLEKAFQYACRNNMHEVIYKILEEYKLHTHMLNVTHNNPLYWCAHHKIENAIHQLLQYKDIDLNIQEEGKKQTILEVICINSLVNVALEILEFHNNKIDLKENRDGDSPFYYACKKGLTNVALKILELTKNKIQLIYKPNEYDNSLLYACFYNMDQVIKIILKSRDIRAEYINSSSYYHSIPLLLCCKHKNEKRALQILDLKYRKSLDIDTSELSRNKKSALYYAIKHNLQKVIPLLINEPILFSPFIKKMFDILSYHHSNDPRYSAIIDGYKNHKEICSICQKYNEDQNYVVKCNKCSTLFHLHCLSEKFKKDFFRRCISCKKESEFYLYNSGKHSISK